MSETFQWIMLAMIIIWLTSLTATTFGMGAREEMRWDAVKKWIRDIIEALEMKKNLDHIKGIGRKP